MSTMTNLAKNLTETTRSHPCSDRMGNCVEERPKFDDERIERCQVASDPGQDDRPFKRRDDQDREIVGTLRGNAEFDQTLRERFEPPVEGTPDHLAELLAGGCCVGCGSHQGASRREMLVGEVTSPVVDDGYQQGARCPRLQLAERSLYPPGR
jgi:hypothetical protein